MVTRQEDISFQSTPSAWRETITIDLRFTEPIFQSTPSAWRETPCREHGFRERLYFNPLPPHGGRLSCWRSDSLEQAISIHSLRMEGDHSADGGAHCKLISIHSLRMEGDLLHREPVEHLLHFNPLPPHGGRPNVTVFAPFAVLFQSTPSAWRETLQVCYNIYRG